MFLSSANKSKFKLIFEADQLTGSVAIDTSNPCTLPFVQRAVVNVYNLIISRDTGDSQKDPETRQSTAPSRPPKTTDNN